MWDPCWGAFLALGNAVQRFGDNWYAASEDWTNFPIQVEDLRREADDWNEQANSFGLANDERLTVPLNRALKLLEEEEQRLKKKKAGRTFQKLCWKLKGVAFPTTLGQSIKKVNEALENIPKYLEKDKAKRAMMMEAILDKTLPLDFGTDRRYVRLHDTETKVRKALVKPDKPQVVLLHGQTGRGKSTLARDLALRVDSQNEQNSNSSSLPSGRRAGRDVAGESSNVSELSRMFDRKFDQMFDRVVFMKFGQEAQLLALQRELRSKLGWNERELRKALAGDETNFEDSEANSSQDLRLALTSLLRDQKVLLIFDDVWNSELLQDMISLCGKNVKCLVTSQDGNLCQRLNCNTFESICMERVSPADGRKNLASHILGVNAEMKDKEIPANVEDLADSLIERVDGNLLALACLATALPTDSESLHDERTWEKVEAEFLQLLDEKDTAKIHNVGYPRSFLAAMEISFENLSREAKMLLILVNLCRGTSMPQEVVEYIYKLLHKINFLKAKEQLEARHLIQVERTQVQFNIFGRRDGPVECFQPGCRFWSIHALWKDYIVRKHKTDELDILETLRKLCRFEGQDEIAESDCEVQVTRVMMGLYLHASQFTQKNAFNMGIMSDDFRTLQERRSVIELLAPLLIFSVNATWNADLWLASRRVLLHYVEHQRIREDDAIILLKSPKSCMAMVNVIGHSFRIAFSVSNKIMDTILGLLGDKASRSQPGLISSISKAIVLAYLLLRRDRKFGVQLGGALKNLFDSLAVDGNPRLQVEAAWALVKFAHYGGQEVCEQISDPEGSLETLIQSLTNDTNPDLQRMAATVLQSLTDKDRGGREVCKKIFNVAGSLKRLVHSLGKFDNPRLQVEVAGILAALANEGGHEFSKKFSSNQRLLQTLLELHSRKGNSKLYKCTGNALRSLEHHGGRDVSAKIDRILVENRELRYAGLDVDNSDRDRYRRIVTTQCV